MKARLSSSFLLGLALSALPLVGACTPQSADQTSFISTASAEPAVAVVGTNTPTEAAAPVALPAADPDAVVAVPAPAVAVPVPEGEKKLPAHLKPTSPAGEIIKLAQAGVEESVMLTYITNSSSMFNLGSDEIIYLNDLGVASNVVTAMLQHDQGLKTFWANQVTPAVTPPAAAQPVETAEAAAPSYVNPPQAEVQPAPTEPAPIVNNNYFYDTLSPYGTWVEIEGYGRCWQPTVVVANRGWRPYADRGRWVYTDSGWYWLSDYSWGATTFHYGRWFSHARYGWCWWPDRVWAPSWVSFRYSGDYCGWAPLPPHAYYRPGLGFSYHGRSVGFGFDFGLSASYFTFVSWNNFCDSRPWHHRVPHHRATQIYNNTTIVNNYVTGNNNTVINRGIGRDRVRELSRTEIKTVKLRDAEPGRSSGGGRGERFDRDGSTLVVNRPQFAETRDASSGRNEKPSRSVLTTPRGGSNLDTPKTETRPVTRPVTRERNEVGRAARVPVTTSPSPSVTPAPTPGTPTPAATKPDSRPTRDREVPGGRGERPGNTFTAPAVVNGPASPIPSAPPVATAPTKSETRPSGPVSRSATPNLIVIGKRENNTSANPTAPKPVVPQVPSPTPRNVQSQSPASRPQRLAEASAPTQTWTAPTTSPTRPEVPKVSRNISSPAPTRSQTPTYTPPSAPTYSAPVSRPTPSYTPRVSNPAPVRSYTPPAVSAPRPTPSVSVPSYSAPRPAPSSPAPSYNPRPAPSAPTPSYSAPRSSSSESRSSSSSGSSGSRSEGGRRER